MTSLSYVDTKVSQFETENDTKTGTEIETGIEIGTEAEGRAGERERPCVPCRACVVRCRLHAHKRLVSD
jgi:hypothetical protein